MFKSNNLKYPRSLLYLKQCKFQSRQITPRLRQKNWNAQCFKHNFADRPNWPEKEGKCIECQDIFHSQLVHETPKKQNKGKENGKKNKEEAETTSFVVWGILLSTFRQQTAKHCHSHPFSLPQVGFSSAESVTWGSCRGATGVVCTDSVLPLGNPCRPEPFDCPALLTQLDSMRSLRNCTAECNNDNKIYDCVVKPANENWIPNEPGCLLDLTVEVQTKFETWRKTSRQFFQNLWQTKVNKKTS